MRAEFVGMRWSATSKVLTARDLEIHSINTALAQCLIPSHSVARVAISDFGIIGEAPAKGRLRGIFTICQ